MQTPMQTAINYVQTSNFRQNEFHLLQLQIESLDLVWTSVVYFYGLRFIEISMALDNLQL